MIGDQHDRMPGGATLLVRAMDGILGTHSLLAVSRSWPKPGTAPQPEAKYGYYLRRLTM
jgi:hypothetical protein